MTAPNDQEKKTAPETPGSSLWNGRPDSGCDRSALTVDPAVDSVRIRAAVNQRDEATKAFSTTVDVETLRQTID